MFLRDTSGISGRTAIEDAFGNLYTYGQLESLGAQYRAMVPERSLALMLCDYSLESVAFYYCLMANHAVPILAEKNLKQDFLQRMILTYEPQFVWCSLETGKGLRDLISCTVFQTGEHLLLQTAFGACQMNPRLALLLTTSGTTGSVKLVRLSYENLRCNIRACSEKIGICKEDRAITTLPMHYCYGLSILHMHWMAGACVCVTKYSLLNAKFWEFFEKARVTNFAGVPYTYDMLRQIGFLDKRYESLRFMTQAGGKLSEKRQMEFGAKLREKGVKLYLCYGQTEGTTYLSVLDSEKVTDKLGSVGAPIPGMSADISDEDTFDTAGVMPPARRQAFEGREGELVCRGPSVCLGYALCKSDLARGDDNLGCLHTGDVVYLDEDGDIFIKGRKSRFVKILGARVSLDEVETALAGRFAGVKFACTGEDNQIWIYYTAEGMEEEIRKYCGRELSVSGKFIQCCFMERLPYGGNGKIRYGELCMRFSGKDEVANDAV